MPKLIDTTQDFLSFAAEVQLESPLIREMRWRDQYEGAHSDVFEAYYTAQGSRDRPAAMIQNLGRVRRHVEESAQALPSIIEEVDAAVGRVMGFPEGEGPVHVLLVGTAGANAVVGRLGDDVAVFHLLEWVQAASAARVAVAHETAHGWHEIHLDEPSPGEDDVAWMAFSEGLAIRVSRAVAPDQPEQDYFWYGIPGFEGWPRWCEEHDTALRRQLLKVLDDPAGANDLFGSGSVEGHHRTGFHVADRLVEGMHRPLPELSTWSVAHARSAVRAALSHTHSHKGAHG